MVISESHPPAPGESVVLAYGQDGLPLDLSGLDAVVLRPRHAPALPDEQAAFQATVRNPFGRKPLRDLIRAHETVAVVVPDGTRPLPSDRLLPWLFAELAHVPPENFIIVIGTGSHRANTPAELDRMFGPDIARRYRIVNHDAHDPATLLPVGRSRFGYEVSFNRETVLADRRIIMGFIEPHFMAGFSGGYKAVFPGVLGLEAIQQYHGARIVGDPLSTWGQLQANPTQDRVREGGAMLPVDFCLNVTLDGAHRITGYFCGETLAAHQAGCAFVKETVMTPCAEPFPIVITTNGGFPLDQNLYQTVKGLSAAARVVQPGGRIFCAARCNDGFPSHGNFRDLLFHAESPSRLLAHIENAPAPILDQWQAQLFALVLIKAKVSLRSELSPEEVRRAFLEPIAEIGPALRAEVRRLGPGTRIAVLPEGPLTIPYLTG